MIGRVMVEDGLARGEVVVPCGARAWFKLCLSIARGRLSNMVHENGARKW